MASHLFIACIDYRYIPHSAHGSLQYFAVVEAYRVLRTKYLSYAKPRCSADNSSQIARILYTFEEEGAARVSGSIVA